MTKPKFYLENRPGSDGRQPINMAVYFNGDKLLYYTGVRVLKNNFRSECNKSNKIKPIKASAPYAVQNNDRLLDMATTAITILTAHKGAALTKAILREQLDLIYKAKVLPETSEKQYSAVFIDFFEELIKNTENGIRILKKGKNKGGRYSDSSIKNYKKTLKAIQRFTKHYELGVLSFDDINKTFYDNFRSYCFNEEKKEVSTFSSFIKDIKVVMSEIPNVTFNAEDFIRPEYEADDIALSLDEISQLGEVDLSDHSRTLEYNIGKTTNVFTFAELELIRDEFLIGCYSGLRFSDLNNLAIEKIEDGFIRVKQIKTGDRITIPIMERLKPLIEKYSDQMPSIPYVKFNYGIREIARIAGLTQLIKVRNNRGNVVNIQLLPLWTQISSHTCRRSYATNMFKAGVPILLIMAVTGHTTEESFLKYIKATNEDKARLLAETYKKLKM